MMALPVALAACLVSGASEASSATPPAARAPMRPDAGCSATNLTRGQTRDGHNAIGVTTLMWSNGRSQMADRELIAAILTAGMLPTLEIPQSRAYGSRGRLAVGEAEVIQRAVDHAFGLYRLVLNELGVDPQSTAEISRQPQAPADVTRNFNQTSDPHAGTEVRWEHTRLAFADPK